MPRGRRRSQPSEWCSAGHRRSRGRSRARRWTRTHSAPASLLDPTGAREAWCLLRRRVRPRGHHTGSVWGGWSLAGRRSRRARARHPWNAGDASDDRPLGTDAPWGGVAGRVRTKGGVTADAPTFPRLPHQIRRPCHGAMTFRAAPGARRGGRPMPMSISCRVHPSILARPHSHEPTSPVAP
jgi:hypothetical protein